MRFLDEYRDRKAVERLSAEIGDVTTRPWTIMEVCGGQTHAIVRFGLDSLLPEGVELVHGPGCPVCVTPVRLIDTAVEIAQSPGVLFCSFGDMLRVPGSASNLFAAKSGGADVRMVYSPMDALALAKKHPEREVVFFAVGFETTAPANAMAIYQAREQGIENFSVLVSHVLVPPAIEALLGDPGNRVQGFLAAGHVCAVMGYEEYYPIAEKFGVPLVVTGFEPVDILEGILLCVRQLEEGRAEVENQYRRAVTRGGNTGAQAIVKKVFRVADREWRGIGEIGQSGLEMAESFKEFDAVKRFGLAVASGAEGNGCLSGEILRGVKKPSECPHFGTDCVPERPMGATMVSTEGACAAYFKYRDG